MVEKDLINYVHSVSTGGGDLTRYIQKFFFTRNMLCGSDPKGESLNTAKKRMDARVTDIINRYHSSLKKGNRIDFIYGHIPFIENAEDVFNRKVSYITTLRDPIKRFVSHHRADINQNNTLKGFKNWVNWVESGKHNLGYSWVEFNHQTDMISNRFGELNSNEKSLQLAKENLIKFKFIGLTEYHDDSVKLLSKIFSFPYIYIKPLNKYKARQVVPIDPDILAYIKERSYLDMELYEFGQSLFLQAIDKHKNRQLILPSKLEKICVFPIKDTDLLMAKIRSKIHNKLFNENIKF